ncbi:MAG: PEP-CTERM sorting domain-containing protein [Sedimentisphaerales bacterium]
MRRMIFTAVVLVGIALTSTASATTILGTVDVENHNNALSDIGTVWGGGLSDVTGYTGVYSWNITGGTGLGTAVPDWGFCIELTQGPYNGWQDVVPLEEADSPTPIGITKANYIRELWGRDFNPAWTTGADKQMAEAFGAAIWEIIYETDPVWNVTSGTGFYATGIEQAATANLWLSQLDGDPAYFANNLVATSSPDGQDYVVQIPEPFTVIMLGFGALSIVRRRKA